MYSRRRHDFGFVEEGALDFDEPETRYSRATADLVMTDAEWKCFGPTKIDFELWPGTKPGQSYIYEREHLSGKHPYFTQIKFHGSCAANSLTTTLNRLRHCSRIRRDSRSSWKDYIFYGIEPGYLIGMSIPPFMLKLIALEVCRSVLGIGYDQYVIDGFDDAGIETPTDGTETGGGQFQQAAA